MIIPLCIPTSNGWDSCHSPVCPVLGIVRLLNTEHSSIIITHCCFNIDFSNYQWHGVFLYAYLPSVYNRWSICYIYLSFLMNLSLCNWWVLRFHCIIWIKHFIKVVICKYSLLVCGFPTHYIFCVIFLKMLMKYIDSIVSFMYDVFDYIPQVMNFLWHLLRVFQFWFYTYLYVPFGINFLEHVNSSFRFSLFSVYLS